MRTRLNASGVPSQSGRPGRPSEREGERERERHMGAALGTGPPSVCSSLRHEASALRRSSGSRVTDAAVCRCSRLCQVCVHACARCCCSCCCWSDAPACLPAYCCLPSQCRPTHSCAVSTPLPVRHATPCLPVRCAHLALARSPVAQAGVHAAPQPWLLSLDPIFREGTLEYALHVPFTVAAATITPLIKSDKVNALPRRRRAGAMGAGVAHIAVVLASEQAEAAPPLLPAAADTYLFCGC